MKRILFFTFFIFLLPFLFIGAGCGRDTSNTENLPSKESQNQDSQVESNNQNNTQNNEWVETSEVLSENELGFTIEPTEAWGEFSEVLYNRYLSSEPDLGEDKEIRGAFSNEKDVVYRATLSAIARGGYVGDNIGYKKKSDGYYVVNLTGEIKIPDDVLVREVPLSNVSALLLSGPNESEGPSFFPNQPNEFAAIINTPNGIAPGGVFIANLGGGNVTIEEFQEMLTRVKIDL
ncbi:hypothetical protein CO172_01445 [Candidatus Uhrbacteria bacterium CG_4_9_14_3_um_filter_36_7]|uniref:Uncharacterized protein n=1 Tax=Candidatus Uhrbacteria bacterium CG_4_9_14_3_um_filter_36_7 TaxID=1975033 RepID=A0A2M7XI61_9BACT|nr:MAG: hypothetical protein CO172_01445 [Candidatus Uhrbacteria bacterium CG_4_9_14_3_um_filter_36_7]